MKKVFALIIFAATFMGCFKISEVFAYVEEKNHPIDIALEKKIDEDSSTYGMIEAYQWAYKEWDKLLNSNYSALLKKLDKDNQERLRASQREWIKYRDLEFAFNENYWGNFDGTAYRVFPYAYQSDFARERALRLGYYLEDLNM